MQVASVQFSIFMWILIETRIIILFLAINFAKKIFVLIITEKIHRFLYCICVGF